MLFLDPSDPSFVEMLGLTKSIESLELYLKDTRGEPTTSEEDMKLCIVNLKIALENQMKLNHAFIARLRRLEAAKSKRRFWKN